MTETKKRRGPADERPLNLLGLKIQNYKRIELAEITPEGSLIILQGENGAGKTSIIDALIAVLGGKRLMSDEALRDDAETGVIVAEIGPAGGPVSLTATRHLRRVGEKQESELVLETPKGPVKAAQTALDVLRGDLSFNPVAFEGMPDRERAEQLLKVAGLDFGKHDADRQEVYERRTLVGQDERTAKALMIEARPESGEEEFDVVPPYDLEPLRAEVEKSFMSFAEAEQIGRTIGDLVDAASRATEAREAAESRHLAAQQAVEATQREEVRANKARDDAKAKDRPNLEFLLGQKQNDQRELDDAQATNVHRTDVARQQNRLDGLTERWEEYSAAYQALTDDLESRDQLKIDALEQAEFPVAGISVTAEGAVRFGEFAFDEAMESDRIRISIAMAMAANPKLRLALVPEGSGLGPEQLALIQELVAQAGGQAIVEMVYTADDQPGVVHVADGFAGDSIPGGLG